MRESRQQLVLKHGSRRCDSGAGSSISPLQIVPRPSLSKSPPSVIRTSPDAAHASCNVSGTSIVVTSRRSVGRPERWRLASTVVQSAILRRLAERQTALNLRDRLRLTSSQSTGPRAIQTFRSASDRDRFEPARDGLWMMSRGRASSVSICRRLAATAASIAAQLASRYAAMRSCSGSGGKGVERLERVLAAVRSGSRPRSCVVLRTKLLAGVRQCKKRGHAAWNAVASSPVVTAQ